MFSGTANVLKVGSEFSVSQTSQLSKLGNLHSMKIFQNLTTSFPKED